jgi:hypothetical protein
MFRTPIPLSFILWFNHATDFSSTMLTFPSENQVFPPHFSRFQDDWHGPETSAAPDVVQNPLLRPFRYLLPAPSRFCSEWIIRLYRSYHLSLSVSHVGCDVSHHQTTPCPLARVHLQVHASRNELSSALPLCHPERSEGSHLQHSTFLVRPLSAVHPPLLLAGTRIRHSLFDGAHRICHSCASRNPHFVIRHSLFIVRYSLLDTCVSAIGGSAAGCPLLRFLPDVQVPEDRHRNHMA